MTAAPAFGDIRAFVEERLAPGDDVTPQTRLLEDLGLDGDEAFEFVEAYAERFGVESGDFDFHRYFGAEGFNPFTILRDAFRKRPAHVPLTVAMLARAAELGVWRTAEVEAA